MTGPFKRSSMFPLAAALSGSGAHKGRCLSRSLFAT